MNVFANKDITDYKKYSEELERIIEAIKLPESTRILVDRLVLDAKKKAEYEC